VPALTVRRAGQLSPFFITGMGFAGETGRSGGEGLTLVHFSAQPKPFWSVSRFVSSLCRVMTIQLLKVPKVSHKKS
jgi:hypothetical protein